MRSDIDPESACRLPLIDRDTLDEIGKKAYDLNATPGRSIAGLQGPGGIGLYSTKTFEARNYLYNYLRFQADYDGQTREIAFLSVAREMESLFEWSMHEPVALKEGVDPTIIEVIRNRASTAGLDDKPAAIIDLAREAFGRHKVSSETYARAAKHFTPHALVDLVLLMGTAASTAGLLAVFDMQLRPDAEPGFST
jgi:4-carboxymuconolactone decarboxylase